MEEWKFSKMGRLKKNPEIKNLCTLPDQTKETQKFSPPGYFGESNKAKGLDEAYGTDFGGDLKNCAAWDKKMRLTQQQKTFRRMNFIHRESVAVGSLF